VSATLPTSPRRTTTVRFEEVAVGDALPALEIPLTRTLIVSTAIASRDYQDVHHDPSLAVDRGSQDIFMNILSTNGLVGRYVTDWSGPGGVLTDVDIRLGAPNYPGDTMTLTGVVTEKDEPSEGSDGSEAYGTIEVAIQGANSLGDHVSGTVRLRLPSRASAETTVNPAGHGEGDR
jgi:acyl dehydratase